MTKKKKIIISIIVVALIATGGYMMKPSKPKGKTVNVVTAAKKDLTQSITVTGNLESGNKYEVLLNPSEKVVEVLAKEGQVVKIGDVLVKYDVTEVTYQLQKAELNLQSAESALNKLLQANGRSTKATTENAVKQAELALENAKNTYEEAKKKADRNQVLLSQGFISTTEYDTSKKAAEEAENTIKASEIKVTNAKNDLGEFSTSNEEDIKEQKRKIESSKLDIENYKNKIDKLTIKSEINGKVTKMEAKEKQYAKNGDFILVEEVSTIKVTSDVSQYDAVSIIKGQKANIKIKGIEKKYTGTVTEIAQNAVTTVKANEKESKVKVEVSIDNPDEQLKSGYEGDVEVIVQEKKGPVAVSFETIKQEKDGSKYIYVVEQNKTVKRAITTGVETDYEVEITKGIKEGEQCIVNPADQLKEGEVVLVGGKKK